MASLATTLILVVTTCLLAIESQGAPTSACEANKCPTPHEYSHHNVDLYHKGVSITRLSSKCYKTLRATCKDPVGYKFKGSNNVKSMVITCDAEKRWHIPTCIRIRDKDGFGWPIVHVYVNGHRKYVTTHSGQMIAVPVGSNVALTCRNKTNEQTEVRWSNSGKGLEKWGRKYLRILLSNVSAKQSGLYICDKTLKGTIWPRLPNYVFIDVLENNGNKKCPMKSLDKKIRYKIKYGELSKRTFATGTVLEFRCKAGRSVVGWKARVCFENGWSHKEFPRCTPTISRKGLNKKETVIMSEDEKLVRRLPRRAQRAESFIVCKNPWIRNGYIRGRTEHPHRQGSTVNIACMDGYTFVDSQNKDGRITCNRDGRWSLTPENVCLASGCSHPGTLDKGSLHFSQNQVGTTHLYPLGTEVKYSCDSHHTLFGGHSTRTCRRTGTDPIGQWSPSGAPMCMWVTKSWGW